MSSQSLPQKKALIIGVSGQDGAYLSKLLLGKNYEIYGTSRDVTEVDFSGLKYLNIDGEVNKVSMCPANFNDVFTTISKVMPDEIYNLSGQSSVGLSFQQPVEAFQSIATGTLNILEAMRVLQENIKFYNAGSGEVFGDTSGFSDDENTRFNPCSPYGVAKAAAALQVSCYRSAYNIYAATGILFNHESSLRPGSYVTKKIVEGARQISLGSSEKLVLGNIRISRDWGYAEDYVEAMWRMLQLDTAQDFVIATGRTVTLEDFLNQAFISVGLDWRNHVSFDESLFRPAEISYSAANPTKAKELLGWSAKTDLEGLVKKLFDCPVVN